MEGIFLMALVVATGGQLGGGDRKNKMTLSQCSFPAPVAFPLNMTSLQFCKICELSWPMGIRAGPRLRLGL